MIRTFLKDRYHLLFSFVIVASLCLNLYFIAPKISIEAPSFDVPIEDGAMVTPIESHSITISVGKGDTLSKVLGSIGISSSESQKIIDATQTIFKSSQLKMGDKVTVEPVTTDINSGSIIAAHPERIVISLDQKDIIITLDQTQEKYVAKEIPVELIRQTKLVTGIINGSLYNAAKNSGADTNVIMSFINLYSYNVDFQRDIKAGDSFKIYYEYKTDKSGRKVKEPKILYAALNSRGDNKDIYLYEMSNGKTDYFDAKGESIRRALLRTPINGARITSSFGLRTHPVLGYSKMHKGLDYGAPAGTPILSAGDGVVAFTKSQPRGYGRHIQIKHNATHATLYAHLSKFASGIKPGTRVSQGQVIGYVGATGMATGPHLHYEVIHNGKKVNPSKISFPKVPPLKGTELARFKKSIIRFETMIADLEEKKSKNLAQVSLKSVFNLL
jgi:murein DD-endopeptidase MepM/ murein hydrolase activator NlpD